MPLGVADIYQLRFKFGSQDISISPASSNRFEITEYLDRFLPTIYIDFRDASGFLTHLTPHDSRYNTMSVSFSNDLKREKEKDLKFKIFRRKPASVVGYSNNILYCGILDIKTMFSPNYQRGWANSSLESVIRSICSTMNFSELNIKTGVSEAVSIVQPNWTNAQMLNYIAEHLKSNSGEAGFLVYCDIPNFFTTRLNFVSLTSLLKQKPKFTYMSTPDAFDSTIYPIHTHEIIDNFDLIAHLGVSKQDYGYFDFVTGKYISRTINLEDVTFQGLSDYFAYDTQDGVEGLSQNYLGVTNNFTKDYDGLARGNYYKKLNSLTKMWITSNGNAEVNPGDIVKVVFPEAGRNVDITDYQYSGQWLVERVKHQFGSVYLTSLLLTRCGVDSGKETTFART